MVVNTLPETNIAPENKPSQKEIHLPNIDFQGRAVSFREGMSGVVSMGLGFRVLSVFAGSGFAREKKYFYRGNEVKRFF